ncbi:hypothetical protein ACFQFH_20105 [Halobaculum halobium]|uniref:Uncharacterized protein n=2 Tax=Halobaculum halobium TaxID=3032281 RepID=A0ABD5TCE2_9EURY
MDLLASYAVQVSAGITATSALGILYEAHRMRGAVERNSERGAANKTRSIGNRRWLQRFGARLVGNEKYQPPHRFDPDEEPRPDGGRQDG